MTAVPIVGLISICILHVFRNVRCVLCARLSSRKAQTTDGRRTHQRRTISFVLGAVLLLALGESYYYAYTQSFESTDDAFIEGNVTDLAADYLPV